MCQGGILAWNLRLPRKVRSSSSSSSMAGCFVCNSSMKPVQYLKNKRDAVPIGKTSRQQESLRYTHCCLNAIMGLVTSFVQIGLSWSSEPDLCDVNLSIRVAWSLPYYVTYASWSQIYMANGICQRSPALWMTECQANTQSRLSEGCSCVPFSNSSALAGSHDVKSRPLKKRGWGKKQWTAKAMRHRFRPMRRRTAAEKLFHQAVRQILRVNYGGWMKRIGKSEEKKVLKFSSPRPKSFIASSQNRVAV